MISCRLITLLISTFVCDASCYMMNQPPVVPCAASCSCTSEDTNWGSAVNVQCGDRNLKSVPSTINDQPVSLLNVSFNVLKTLTENALLSYESVRYLYLQDCKIFNINEKAFQRLENLTVIDLSINRLTTISPNLFNSNHLLDKLILGSNYFGILQWNTPILNGPSSLSFLDLQSCKLSNISSITFSLLLNLKFLDISRNDLILLNPDILSSHQTLEDVNLESNPLKCGTEFEGLLFSMQSKLSLSHSRKLQCRHKNGTWDTRVLEKRSSLFRPITTPLTREFVTVVTADLTTVSAGVPLLPKASPYTSRVVETAATSKTELGAALEFTTDMAVDSPLVSVGVPLSSETSPHTSRVVETAVTNKTELGAALEFATGMAVDSPPVSVGVPLSSETSPHTSRVVETAVTSEVEHGVLPESERGGWANLLSWNTLMVLVILPITLCVAVFVSLTAVNYITKRYRFYCPQPVLNPQLRTDRTNQLSGDVNRSSENIRNNENHIYEEIR